jgi:hypothetical protein
MSQKQRIDLSESLSPRFVRLFVAMDHSIMAKLAGTSEKIIPLITSGHEPEERFMV